MPTPDELDRIGAIVQQLGGQPVSKEDTDKQVHIKAELQRLAGKLEAAQPPQLLVLREGHYLALSFKGGPKFVLRDAEGNQPEEEIPLRGNRPVFIGVLASWIDNQLGGRPVPGGGSRQAMPVPERQPAVIESRKSYILFEDSERPLNLRVWRAETEVRDFYDNADINAVCDVHQAKFKPGDGRSALAKAVFLLPRINAVEVTDKNGNGVVLYPEWP